MEQVKQKRQANNQNLLPFQTVDEESKQPEQNELRAEVEQLKAKLQTAEVKIELLEFKLQKSEDSEHKLFMELKAANHKIQQLEDNLKMKQP